MCFLAQQSALVLLIVNSVFGSHLPNTSCPPSDVTYTPPSPPPLAGSTGGSCKIPDECGGMQICSKSGICEAPECSTDADCEAKTDHPVKCQTLGAMSSCVHQFCDSNNNCTKLGEGYGCYLNQCKPRYGKCTDSCDCVTMYGLQQGEGICEEKNCFCRTRHISECKKTTSPPGIDPITPPVKEDITTTKPPAQTPPIHRGNSPSPNDTCIVPAVQSLGNLNDACSVQSACNAMSDLVCSMDNGTDMGTCKQLSCTTNAECIKGSFPMECGGGFCRKKDCSNTVCPDGYGCYSDGQCKKILGKCDFVCDCGECPELDCFKNQCYCTNDLDACGTPSGLPNPPIGGISVPKVSHENCSVAECPSDWVKTSVGCYKLISELSSFDDAVSKCKAQKGFLAKVDSKKEMEELLGSVLENGILVTWIGLKKTDGVAKWVVDLTPIEYSPSAYVRIETDPEKACVQTFSTYWQNSLCSSMLPALCEINPSNKK
ncbi:uncharacterized protein LOC111710063 isoform X2 [Eurytemora carolleeae]|uniref:uncharacterized protein LOC111710063 isoform X2 n=1 Tax=Eurytemora carolleeae TaxID=1294199 RepID=UPI000C782A67|nr:uncharacterized protein LOC111710063 isoform X2 [Eurytemora carolleeae]|eukprot:XP_023339852.1 uncharacterized protein LOC111710063 isoform X2 [Eurytemora affinis]